jgi:[ribosomal protein S18]-alanine N-acetyltransferase
MSDDSPAMNQISIRPATPADIPDMMRLTDHSATAAHWSREQYDQIFDPSSPNRLGMVVRDSQGLQGFLIAQGILDEWEIENIAIAGPARRRGLGTRLLGEFLDQARAQGARAVFLEVRESNRAACALYEKWSFERSARRSRYYSDPVEDAIIYRHTFA